MKQTLLPGCTWKTWKNVLDLRVLSSFVVSGQAAATAAPPRPLSTPLKGLCCTGRASVELGSVLHVCVLPTDQVSVE